MIERSDSSYYGISTTIFSCGGAEVAREDGRDGRVDLSLDGC